MSWKSLAQNALTVAIVIIALSLILGSVFAQPVLLSYVETGSMSPSLEPGDGFVAVPAQLHTSVDEGDVVVFRAQNLHGGGLTTHRIAGETDQGFITKGDANPFVDQNGEEPPVKGPQIVAKALQINGNIVVIPALGTAVEGSRLVLSGSQDLIASAMGTSLIRYQDLAYVFFFISIIWYILAERRDLRQKERNRNSSRLRSADSRLIVIVFAALLITGATAAMVVPAGSQQYGVVSAEFTSERPNVIPMGESKNQLYPVGNGGVIPVIAYIEPASEGVEVEPQEVRVGGRSVTNATVTLHAPPETGYYRRFIVEHRYLALLPQPVIHGLYQIHPWAPIVAIDALIGVPFYLIGITLVGTGPVRQRTSSRDTSTAVRLTRLVRNIYR